MTKAPERRAYIVGSIVTPDGTPAPQAEIQASERSGGSSGLTAADDSGRFSIGPLSAGTWSLWIRVPDQPTTWTEWREVGVGARLDLGTIWLPVAGTIRVRLHGTDGLDPYVAVSDASLAHWTGFEREGRERRSKPLAPGPHFLMLSGHGIAAQIVPIEVRAGEERAIDLEVRRGRPEQFEVVAPAHMTERHVRILQAGKLVTGWSAVGRRPEQFGPGFRRDLAPGDYVITVSGNGMSGERSFTVAEGDNEVVRVVLR